MQDHQLVAHILDRLWGMKSWQEKPIGTEFDCERDFKNRAEELLKIYSLMVICSEVPGKEVQKLGKDEGIIGLGKQYVERNPRDNAPF